jgi:hypothetical protein
LWSDRHRPQCDVYVGFLLVLLSCHRKQIPPHLFRISEDTHPSPFFFGSEAASVIPHEGAFDGVNPVQDARIPRNAREARETFAYSLAQIYRALNILPLLPKAVIATASFAGLREGELRGLEWADYTGDSLNVNRSIWKSFVNGPKTRASAQAPKRFPSFGN